ncbi:MAG: TIGR02466 family protein [Tardiphaga sp.]
MALDAWFPLAIYYEDLGDAGLHNPALAQRIRDLFSASGERRTGATASWTGDVHNVDRLHLDPAFDWLTDQVGWHALKYLQTLGHDLTKTDIYVQRAWPVVAHRGQRVARHAHHTAHVSAVYYVVAPQGEGGGQLQFINEALPNEVSAGIGSSMTKGYFESNPLNYGGAVYRPIAGRLLLFPAKQPHEVEANQTDEERISISYDLVITSRATPDQGHHEFLMPPPALWKQIGCHDSRPAASPAASLPENRWPLARVSRFSRDADGFTIPDREGHVLWEPVVLAHCSSRAAWDSYAAALAQIPPHDWQRDPSGAIWMWPGCRDWPACQDAVDRLYVHLRNRDVPLDGASLSAPVLQKRLNGAAAPYRRGETHLCIYLRIDYGDANDCALEFAEGGSIELAPGAMVAVGGARRHRLRGASHVIHLQLDVPAIARATALKFPPLQSPDVADHLVFAALVAQPVGLALPSSDVLLQKIEWLASRASRRNRHEACPAVTRFLLEHANPASATAAELDIIRSYGFATATSFTSDGRLVEDVAALNAGQCEILCRFADSHMTSIMPDTVDDLPEYQVDLSLEDLTVLVGRDTVAALMRLPEALGAPRDTAANELYERIHIFLRMYSPQTRPYIAFHADTCAYTVNIALNDDTGFEGGRLLALNGSTLMAPSRRVGTAILHAGTLVHGVTKIERGTRYSLILFFHRKADASGHVPEDVASAPALSADFANAR